MRALLLVPVLALVFVPLGGARVTYSDPTGDSGRVADIRGVTVSNSADGSVVDMRVHVASLRHSFLAAMLSTSATPGVERAVVVVGRTPGGLLVTIVLNRYGTVLPGISVSGVITKGVVRLRLPREALGIGRRFDFWLMSGRQDETSEASDRAPNSGFWRYELVAGPP